MELSALVKLLALVVLIFSMVLSGCSTTSGHWGASTTLTPSWSTIKTSAKSALYNPNTWVPLAGAALWSIDDWDHQTVEWAAEHNPLFGSREDASKASDDLKSLSRINYGLSVLATPSGTGRDKFINKSKGLAAGALAIYTNSRVSQRKKSLSKRKRPLQSTADDSFPSLHTSTTSVAAALAASNIEHTALSTTQKSLWRWSSYSLAGLTGWARVEAGVHYPSDVLVGYALGNFIGIFFNNAFIAPKDRDNIKINAYVDAAGNANIGLSIRW